MKKTIFAPLCSAIVIPGLGQVINGDLKKALGILLAVLVLFVAGIVKLAFILQASLGEANKKAMDSSSIMENLGRQDLSSLWVLAALFAVVWLYSVIDAYGRAREQDRAGKGKRL